MCPRLRRRHSETPAEALWCDACGSGPARRLRKRSGERPEEVLWRVVYGSAMARGLRKRYGATAAECYGSSPAGALLRDTCGSALVWRLRKR